MLVVFIVTAAVLTSAIPINVPKTETVAPVEQKDPLVVSINGPGKLFLNKMKSSPICWSFNLKSAKAKDPEVRVQLPTDDGELRRSRAGHSIDQARMNYQVVGNYSALIKQVVK